MTLFDGGKGSRRTWRFIFHKISFFQFSTDHQIKTATIFDTFFTNFDESFNFLILTFNRIICIGIVFMLFANMSQKYDVLSPQ